MLSIKPVRYSSSGVEQMLLEELEEQKAFPATPNASKNLNHVVILGLNQSVQQQIAFDDHFAFHIVNTLSWLKVLCQKHHGFVGRTFRKVDILMMLKADDESFVRFKNSPVRFLAHR